MTDTMRWINHGRAQQQPHHKQQLQQQQQQAQTKRKEYNKVPHNGLNNNSNGWQKQQQDYNKDTGASLDGTAASTNTATPAEQDASETIRRPSAVSTGSSELRTHLATVPATSSTHEPVEPAKPKRLVWSEESEDPDDLFFHSSKAFAGSSGMDNVSTLAFFARTDMEESSSTMQSSNNLEKNTERKKIVMPEFYKWDEEKECPDARFEILHFRTLECPYQDECPRKDAGYCDRVHHHSQMRRCPVFSDGQLRYSSVKCANMVGGSSDECPAGNACAFAHSAAEVAYHPFVFRTKMCPNNNCKDLCCPFAHAPKELRNGMQLCGANRAFKTRFCMSYPAQCPKPVCQMAHSREEIRSELLTEEEETYVDDSGPPVSPKKMEYFLINRFKTLHCPYGKVHDWQKCPYAHNIQDIRRNPQVYNYSAIACWNWKNNPDNMCPLRNQCPNAHGPKESLYHPDTLHTKPCTVFLRNGYCVRGSRCAYKHTIEDKNDAFTDGLSNSRTGDRAMDHAASNALPSSEIDAKVCRLFFHFDEDRDGYLCKSKELRTFVETIGVMPISDEEYGTFCNNLSRTISLSKVDFGLSHAELQTAYKNFGKDIVDRDYDAVFHSHLIKS